MCWDCVYAEKNMYNKKRQHSWVKIILLSQKRSSLFFLLATSTGRSKVRLSWRKTPWSTKDTSAVRMTVELNPSHLVEGQYIFQLTVAPLCPPTVQLVCVGLHWINLHLLGLTFAIVAHWRGVWLVLGVWLVYWCLSWETTECVFSL